jgi:hypothetical protein
MQITLLAVLQCLSLKYCQIDVRYNSRYILWLLGCLIANISTSITCTGISTDNSNISCVFAIKIVIRGNITGSMSDDAQGINYYAIAMAINSWYSAGVFAIALSPGLIPPCSHLLQ